MAVSKRTRYEVLRRDDHTCRYCGGRAPDVVLTVDHVVPTALGGSDDPSNLVAACQDCNAGKAASTPDAPLVAQVADDAVRWATAMRAAVDGWLAARADGWAYCDPIARRWDEDNDTYRFGRAGLPDDWTDTVERWRGLGIPTELVVDAVGAAMRRRQVRTADVWRYTCGIVWSKLTELQQQAFGLASLDGTNREASGDPLGDEYYRGFVDASVKAQSRFSSYQHLKLCEVIDAEGMAWVASR